MADVYEQNLPQKTDLTTSDYVRVVGSDNNSYKQPLSDVAQKTVENYAGSTLAGSAQSVKSAIDGLNTSINGVASDLASESSTRASQDTNLQTQINQLVAPTGTAPNPAEIENARIGADNVTYTTLGDAIRTQVTDLKSALTDETNARILLAGRMTTAEGDIDTLETHKVAQPLDEYNQPTDGTSGQSLRTNGNGTTEWADVGLPTDAQTANAVSEWLNEHPEATTTVQDGSLTEAKFANTLKLKTIKDYVTPQMFGAKADGVTDDLVAVQSAVDSGKAVFFPNGTYRLTDSIVVDEGCNWLLDNKATLFLDSSEVVDCFIQVTNQYQTHDYDSRISGGSINGNYKCNVALGLHGYRHLKIDHIRIENFNSVGVNTAYNRGSQGADCGECTFDSLLIRNSRYVADSLGIFDSHDNMYNNIVVQDVCTGFLCGPSSYDNCHYWTSIEAVFDASVAFEVWNESLINNAIVDTCRTGFLFKQNSNALLNNILFEHNNIVISQDHANAVGIYLFDLEEGARMMVNNLNCLLYQGYTNVNKFTDRVLTYNENNYVISFNNDFYLAPLILKNDITRNETGAIRDLYAIKNLEALTSYNFKVPKFFKTNYAHFIIYGGQSWKWNFFMMGIVNDLQEVSFFPVYNPDNITFTGAYSGATLTINASTTLYGGIRLLWLN